MALTEKQAIIVGVGGLAALYLLKGKTLHAAPAKVPTKLRSSASQPSANLATRGATSTRAQAPSIIGLGQNRIPGVAPSTSDKIWAALAALFPKQTGPILGAKPSTPTTAPRKSGPTAGGGSGGSSSQAQRSGYQAPGGNPWSTEGDFTGRSSVTANTPDNQGNLGGYDTGVSSTSDAGGEVGIVPGQSPQNSDLLASVDPDGSASDDPAAIEYADSGPQVPVGYDPETGTWEDQGPTDQAPLLNATPLPGLNGSPVDTAADPADDFGVDSSSYYEGGGGGDSAYADDALDFGE